MHYLELDDDGCFHGIFPLEEEIANTTFHDGILIPVLSSVKDLDFHAAVSGWRDLTAHVVVGSHVNVYRLVGIPLASAKLGTDYGCGYGHIERL